ncbi:MAG: alpha/beta hydrolase [Thermomicrobiales bacterium]|nr:alpha/beta hydrolase [Thermomicrobiales bacterium]
MRGFGGSSGGTGDFAHHEDLADLIAALNLGPVRLVGCSFGGRVAIDAALAYPALIERLALINPALGGYPWPEDLDASEEAIEAALEAGDIDAAAEVDLRVWVDGPSRQPDEVDADVRERARVMARQVYDAGEPAGAMVALTPPAIERLGEIRVPTLVISGALDQPMMRDIATLIGECVAGSRVVSLPDVAHLANMEAPDAVNNLLLEFFTEQDAAHEHR